MESESHPYGFTPEFIYSNTLTEIFTEHGVNDRFAIRVFMKAFMSEKENKIRYMLLENSGYNIGPAMEVDVTNGNVLLTKKDGKVKWQSTGGTIAESTELPYTTMRIFTPQNSLVATLTSYAVSVSHTTSSLVPWSIEGLNDNSGSVLVKRCSECIAEYLLAEECVVLTCYITHINAKEEFYILLFLLVKVVYEKSHQLAFASPHTDVYNQLPGLNESECNLISEQPELHLECVMVQLSCWTPQSSLRYYNIYDNKQGHRSLVAEVTAVGVARVKFFDTFGKLIFHTQESEDCLSVFTGCQKIIGKYRAETGIFTSEHIPANCTMRSLDSSWFELGYGFRFANYIIFKHPTTDYQFLAALTSGYNIYKTMIRKTLASPDLKTLILAHFLHRICLDHCVRYNHCPAVYKYPFRRE